MKKVKKILNIVTNVTTIILFFLTITVLIVGIRANSQNKIPKLLGYTYSVVPTNSMVPTIQVGDIVITKEKDFEEVDVEDIIVFYSQRDNKYIVHRVVEIKEEGTLITKGDNNPAKDPDEVTSENYVGTVVKIVRKVGTLVLNYRNIMFTIIILIFVIIIINEVKNIIKNINEDRRQKLEQQLLEKYSTDDNDIIVDNNKDSDLDNIKDKEKEK
ncbi:MAG: signal peptidase I [Bacilli bacterium]|nr:signal peptidase I [Bacilli bacterium]